MDAEQGLGGPVELEVGSELVVRILGAPAALRLFMDSEQGLGGHVECKWRGSSTPRTVRKDLPALELAYPCEVHLGVDFYYVGFVVKK